MGDSDCGPECWKEVRGWLRRAISVEWCEEQRWWVMWSQRLAGVDPVGRHKPCRSSDAALSVTGSYLRVLSRGVVQPSLCLRKKPLATVCGVDCRGKGSNRKTVWSCADPGMRPGWARAGGILLVQCQEFEIK